MEKIEFVLVSELSNFTSKEIRYSLQRWVMFSNMVPCLSYFQFTSLAVPINQAIRDILLAKGMIVIMVMKGLVDITSQPS